MQLFCSVAIRYSKVYKSSYNILRNRVLNLLNGLRRYISSLLYLLIYYQPIQAVRYTITVFKIRKQFDDIHLNYLKYRTVILRYRHITEKNC